MSDAPHDASMVYCSQPECQTAVGTVNSALSTQQRSRKMLTQSDESQLALYLGL